MTIVAIILVIPSILVERLFIPRIQAENKNFSKFESSVRTFLKEAIYSLDIIKIFQLFTGTREKMTTLDTQRRQARNKLAKFDNLIFSVSNMLGYVAILGTLAVGGFLYVKNKITIPNLIVCIGTIEGGIIWPISNIIQDIIELSRNKVSYDRVNEFLELQTPDIDYKIVQNANVDISLQNVSFSYTDTDDKFILKNVNLEIPHGSKICITGPSGTGKSTLIHLLLGTIKAQKGSITIKLNSKNYDGVIQNLISFVPQTAALFLDSIYENIRFGNPAANDTEIYSASEKAFADEFIQKCDDRYKTIVGGKDTKLSGGQAQRITIARAVLKQSPVLIMDEPSSALDEESEKRISDLIRGYNGTVIYISHREELMKAANKVVTLNDGVLTETNTNNNKQID